MKILGSIHAKGFCFIDVNSSLDGKRHWLELKDSCDPDAPGTPIFNCANISKETLERAADAFNETIMGECLERPTAVFPIIEITEPWHV